MLEHSLSVLNNILRGLIGIKHYHVTTHSSTSAAGVNYLDSGDLVNFSSVNKKAKWAGRSIPILETLTNSLLLCLETA